MDEVRAANREIGRRYDAQPYDPAIGFSLDPDVLLAPRDAGAADVLDLGCGTGGQLWRAGQLTGGRLVGVDISAAACAVARARMAGYGERARIVCSDLLDVEAAALGRFDLVYLVGTYYATPPEVRAHLAALIGGCLAPGGRVVTSYYSGAAGRARAAEVAAVRAGRAAIPAAADDPVMAFELLSPWLEVFDDGELAAALGLRFLGHVGPAPVEGGYRFGVFSDGGA